MGLTDVSNMLWRERELLELLQFKLEEEQLVLASGKARWLTHATREVEIVLEEIKRAELARAVEVESLAAELGLGPNPSLRQLVEHAPPPWGGIFDEHRTAFLAATQEIMTLAQLNRELLSKGYKAAREALAWLGDADPSADLYSPTGTTATRRSVPRILDEAM